MSETYPVGNNTYTTRTTCRICDSPNLTPLFSLGTQFVSDFVDKEHVLCGHKCPIDLVLCENCTLVQLRHTAPQDFLYTRHYWYRSSVTKTMRDQLRDITSEVEWQVDLRPDDVVLDIGSNDGQLLRSYVHPCIKIGVEPAKNLFEEGKQGVDVLIGDFWPPQSHLEEHDFYINPRVTTEQLSRVQTGGVKVVTAIGMFYDLEDPNAFIAAVAKSLSLDGIFIAQLMCLKNMLSMNDVGNLAHEHLEFYSLKSLQYLYNRHGMEIYDIETNDTNGQSYRIYARHKGSDAGITQLDNVRLHEMQEVGLNRPEFYAEFFSDMEQNKIDTVEFIRDAVKQGKRVWWLGASTKSNVILQYYGLDSTLIEAAAERTPEKVGKYTVGTGIPIKSEEEFRQSNPDVAVIGPFAFQAEIMKREAEWKKSRPDNTFLIPLPSMRLV